MKLFTTMSSFSTLLGFGLFEMVIAQTSTCQTVTLASSLPSTPLALQSYSYCGGNLNATVYVQVRMNWENGFGLTCADFMPPYRTFAIIRSSHYTIRMGLERQHRSV